MRFLHTENAPAAIGPYSQAVEIDGWVYTSGQVALDPATMELVAGGFEPQAKPWRVDPIPRDFIFRDSLEFDRR